MSQTAKVQAQLNKIKKPQHKQAGQNEHIRKFDRINQIVKSYEHRKEALIPHSPGCPGGIQVSARRNTGLPGHCAGTAGSFRLRGSHFL